MAAVSCAEIRELFSARMDDALSAEERAALEAHLATCPECVQEWRRFEGTVSLLRATEPARAPAGFVDRVLAARPQPWYRRLGRMVLVPWTVKLPLSAAAVILVAGLAVVIFQRSPDLQREAYAPVPASAPSHPRETAAPAPAPETAGRHETPLYDSKQRAAQTRPLDRTAPDAAAPKVDARDGTSATTPPPATTMAPATAPAPAPPPTTAPSATSPARAPFKEGARQDTGPPTGETGKDSNAARDATESQRRAKLAESPPLGAAGQEGFVKREPAAGVESGLKAATEAKKDVADERTRQAAPAPRAMQKSGEVQRLAAVPPPGSQARLPVTDPVAAERTVRDLVARANGHVASRVEDGAAIVLSLAVPPDRWEELKRGLENLGALRLEPRPEEGARFVRLTLRLER